MEIYNSNSKNSNSNMGNMFSLFVYFVTTQSQKVNAKKSSWQIIWEKRALNFRKNALHKNEIKRACVKELVIYSSTKSSEWE